MDPRLKPATNTPVAPASSSSAIDSTMVRVINPLEVSDWDQQVARLPGSGFFHTAAWVAVLHETYGHRPRYLIRHAGNGATAVLPLVEMESWLTGRRGVSLPFTDAIEALGCDADTFASLFQAAQELAKERAWKYLECRGGRQWLPDAVASTSFLGHQLSLAAGESALFSGFAESVRRALRKSEHGGLTVEFSQSPAAVRDYYALQGLTRRRHGVPPQPYGFFANIQKHILAKNGGWVVLARKGTTPVAGGIFFHFGPTALYKFGASDETYQQLRANNLVMWHAIRRYAAEGFTHLDFGRTSLGNDGLRRFKLGWGVKEHRIDYVRYSRKASAFVVVPDGVTGWHNRLFRALPPMVSRAAGSLLYRHIT
jgi:hypothetical protein